MINENQDVPTTKLYIAETNAFSRSFMKFCNSTTLLAFTVMRSPPNIIFL